MVSHLTRGAWIEIIENLFFGDFIPSRTSHEVRGLKYLNSGKKIDIRMSHLTRGAWIEIENGFSPEL